MIRRRVVAHGLVQGVFFRVSCQQEADRHGVAGWVSNRPDGTVEAVLEGRDDAVEQVVAWMYEGPPRAAVDRVEVAEEEPVGESNFEVR